MASNSTPSLTAVVANLRQAGLNGLAITLKKCGQDLSHWRPSWKEDLQKSQNTRETISFFDEFLARLNDGYIAVEAASEADLATLRKAITDYQ